MAFLSAERISEHRYKTPEGYLVCTDSILARTGKQTYRRSEIFGDDDERLVEVDRKEDEVFSKETLASFENKPICVGHPDVKINAENLSQYAVGFVRDVRRGEYEGVPVMFGTLVITDAKTVEGVENGKHTDLSCGYDCDTEDTENPQQRRIRGNHVALCERGRAGIARIVDSANDEESTYTEVTENLEKEANKDMSWLDSVIKEKKEEVKDAPPDFETQTGKQQTYEHYIQVALDKAGINTRRWNKSGSKFNIDSNKMTIVATANGIKCLTPTVSQNCTSTEDVVKFIKQHLKDSITDKDYVPFPAKDELTPMNITKEQALSFISGMLKDKNNTVEDSEGVIYLTQKAYNDIKAMVKNYGITQKELEGISKYFFGPGGYNMFK